MIKKLQVSEFTKNSSKVLTGNLIGSLVFFLSIPVISRIYPPSIYGNYQLYISLVAILNAISSLKFERTIVLGKNDYESKLGVKLTFFSLLIFCMGLFLISIFFNKPLFELLNSESISSYYWLIVIAVLLEGTLTIVSQIAIRKGYFGKISINRMFQLSGYGLFPILLALFSESFTMLIVARFIVYILSILLLLRPTGFISTIKEKTNLSDIKSYGKYHRKFPTFSVPNNFLNLLSVELPVFMIAKHFGESEIGLYAMGLRVMQMPLSIIKNSVSDVYFKSATNAYHTSKHKFLETYVSSLKKMVLLSLLALILVPLAYYFIPIFLGPVWEKTALILVLLSPYLILNFICSPLSGTLPIMNKQEFGLYLIAGSIVLRFVFMYIFRNDFYQMIFAFSITSMLFYAFYIFLIYRLIKGLTINDKNFK